MSIISISQRFDQVTNPEIIIDFISSFDKFKNNPDLIFFQCYVKIFSLNGPNFNFKINKYDNIEIIKGKIYEVFHLINKTNAFFELLNDQNSNFCWKRPIEINSISKYLKQIDDIKNIEITNNDIEMFITLIKLIKLNRNKVQKRFNISLSYKKDYFYTHSYQGVQQEDIPKHLITIGSPFFYTVHKFSDKIIVDLDNCKDSAIIKYLKYKNKLEKLVSLFQVSNLGAL